MSTNYNVTNTKYDTSSEFRVGMDALKANPDLFEYVQEREDGEIWITTRSDFGSFDMLKFKSSKSKNPYSVISYLGRTPMQILSDYGRNAKSVFFDALTNSTKNLMKAESVFSSSHFDISKEEIEEMTKIIKGYAISSSQAYEESHDENPDDNYLSNIVRIEKMRSINAACSKVCMKLTSNPAKLAYAAFMVFEQNPKMTNNFMFNVEYAFLGFESLALKDKDVIYLAANIDGVDESVNSVIIQTNGEVQVPDTSSFEQIQVGADYNSSTLPIKDGFARFVSSKGEFVAIEVFDSNGNHLEDGIYSYNRSTGILLKPTYKTVSKLQTDAPIVAGFYDVRHDLGKHSVHLCKVMTEEFKQTMLSQQYRNVLNTNVTSRTGKTTNCIFAMQYQSLTFTLTPVQGETVDSAIDRIERNNNICQYKVDEDNNILYLMVIDIAVATLEITGLNKVKQERIVDYSALNGYVCRYESSVDEEITLKAISSIPWDVVSHEETVLGIDKDFFNVRNRRTLDFFGLFFEQVDISGDYIDIYCQDKEKQEIVISVDRIGEHDYELTNFIVNDEECSLDMDFDMLSCIYRLTDKLYTENLTK